jgi:hypothetical protein
MNKEPENYNPKNIKYGLIAIDPEEKGEEKTILHFCGYWEIPKQSDVDSLREEFKNDSEFGLQEIADRLDIVLADENIMETYRNMIKENENNNN